MREITETQIASVTSYHSNNQTWYEVPSATSESVYTVRFKGKAPFDNCPHQAATCWHCRAALIAESRYQAIAREERENEAKLAAMRELQAFNKLVHGGSNSYVVRWEEKRGEDQCEDQSQPN